MQEPFLIGLFALICIYTICVIADSIHQFKHRTTCSVDKLTVLGSVSGTSAVILMLIAHCVV